MSEEIAGDPVLIRPPPISVAEELFSSIRPLDRNPDPPTPPEPAEELNQLQSIAFEVPLLEGTTTAADEDFRNKCCCWLTLLSTVVMAIDGALGPTEGLPLKLCKQTEEGH